MGNTEFRQLKSNNTAYKYYVEIHVSLIPFTFSLLSSDVLIVGRWNHMSAMTAVELGVPLLLPPMTIFK